MRAAAVLLAAFAGLGAEPAQARWTIEEADVDGVQVSVEMWSNRKTPAELAAAAIDEYARVRRLTDPVDPGSELSIVNGTAAAEAVAPSPELFMFIDLAIDLATRTGGAFDPRASAASEAAGPRGGAPFDSRSVEVSRERGTVRFKKPQLRLDASTVATGFALARAADFLRANGVEHARLAARGIVYYVGDRRGREWLHGVALETAPPGQVARLVLADAAVASVGRFAVFRESEVVRFEDLPSRPGSPGVHSATVFGPNPLIAEGLANLIFRFGVVAGFELLRIFPGYQAIVFDYSGDVAHSVGLDVVYGNPRR